MKKNVIGGTIIAIFGLLIAIGPQFLFKVCSRSCSCCGDIPQCHWTAQAELGLGFLISALGLCFIFFNNMQAQLGLIIGVFFSSIVALFIPHGLIGGCAKSTMACHRVAFPALTIISTILLIASVIYMVLIRAEKILIDNSVSEI